MVGGHGCVDVAVVGCGPVGMTLAALLGKAGHSVVVFERYPGLYGLPRAASLDGEVMRALQGLGLADELAPALRRQEAYEWRNGAGELLIRQVFRAVGTSGWADLYMFHQPDLEKALHGLCAALPNVDIRFGTKVTGLTQDRDRVTLDTADGTGLAARHVVGCDGGNSFVRAALDIEQDDLGFAEPWLVCDFELRRPAAELGLPPMLQIGDPEGPTTVITTTAGRQRFAFMLDEGDDAERERTAERVWSRVARHLSRDDADIVRAATYTFQSLVARRWRDGRVLLAGDAAHQMPPFLGQGMCAGIRDVLNIAFKLDLVRRGVQGADVLDTYQSEREPHVRGVTELSVELGREHTVRDPVLARERDTVLKARQAALKEPERIRLPDLGPGLFASGGGGLSVQGRVSDGRRTGLLDEIVGGGFRLLVTAEALPLLDVPALADLGVTVVGFGATAAGRVVADLDGTHRRWLADLGATAAAVRPDHYVYAAGPDATEVADRLMGCLSN
ncbi:bifunctional 3-(3-hydroxy-phenyl)propionate/3-hydroxycinnamic acid hydroxylase [Streptomyces kanamyceticus]|uniref:Bifunctional 3-(3-hydroxy-phenyl)propionate/3-hydroxycinnamic acid hydroxylase n=1 Tax=Streptomyces kanamyceticus TaxID=1967 RepID=A0A5J6GNE0_STRKN|nr:bifunctional 3-(3-hydroxy-phenyl)propionate/3-hydroxycinnamic acid hydroxylase [Streptomyces kanamyceticus]QEU96787.1 bifunctional 3-(3-hydroxy-phenyl)propionate/3-hydroxycinnamic acid hydroxylase [Streptomyces kanamyceticus]